MEKPKIVFIILMTCIAFNLIAEESPELATSPGIEDFSISDEGPDSFIAGSSLEVFDPSPPTEAAIFGGQWSEGVKTGVRLGSMAGLASSLALSAGGIGYLFSSAGNGFDTVSMHDGILMTISGGIFSSLFTIIFDATRSTSKE